jgi:hypothetical protein
MRKALISPIRNNAGVRMALGTNNISEDMFETVSVGEDAASAWSGTEGGRLRGTDSSARPRPMNS